MERKRKQTRPEHDKVHTWKGMGRKIPRGTCLRKNESTNNKALPKMQIGGIKRNSSSEHLIVVKTWMKTNQVGETTCIFEAFDMEKFFDKEGLIDTLHTMYTQGKIAKSDYRMWFYLNNKTKISVLTPLGETDQATIMNGIGQGSSVAALASSLNIGCGVEGITRGICSANIGELELNSLIFQDDIAKMNYSMEDSRKGARDVGRLLESKQLRANTSKSKFVVIGSKQSRTEILKDAANNPIMMGTTVIENSKSEKYLCDQIHEDGCEASIAATLDGRISGAIKAGEQIIRALNHPATMGHKMAEAVVEEYAMRVSSENFIKLR